MSFKFKEGDKVRILKSVVSEVVGKEGIVTELMYGVSGSPGAIVYHKDFPTRAADHAIWAADDRLELVTESTRGWKRLENEGTNRNLC